jgi:flagellin
MALSVLNNIPSLVAQNNLAVTNKNLQNTLFQLSSGSRINSGADDPAGLSIVNGLQANISALQQSSQNATAGVGQLQVADGALSQVTSLLNRAVTLATQAANGGLTTAQFAAVNNEYESITSEIARIGAATNFNGNSVFQSATVANPNVVDSSAASGVTATTALTSGKTFTLNLGTNAYTFTPGTAASTLVTGSIGGLTSSTALTNGKTLSITNSGGTVNFTAATLKYSGATAGLTAASALTAGDSLTVTNSAGSATYTFTAADKMSNLLSAINTTGAASGISAYLDASGHLQIAGSAANGNVTVTQSAANTTDVGALTGTANTVGDLENQINSSGYGLTATLDATGHLNIQSSNGNVTLSNNTLTQVGTLSNTSTVQDLANWINGGGGGAFSGVSAGLATVSGQTQLVITDTQNRGDLTATNYDTVLGSTGGGSPSDSFASPTMTGAASTNVFISDGQVSNSLYYTIPVSIGALTDTQIGSNTTTLGTQNLSSAVGATAALTVINTAISDVAAMRGTIGAGINRLNSATNVINTQVQNLTSAQSSIQDADVGQVVANMSKYQVLEQTGISALAQSNSNEQAVLKLLQ